MITRGPRRHLLMPLIFLVAACAGAPAVVMPDSSTVTPSATPRPATPLPLTATPASAAPTAGLSPVPRNRTVLVGWGLDQKAFGITNPLNPRHNFQDGNVLLWEGLAYYAIFADREIPWLAQSMKYTKSDFTELTIKLNPLARWSDGQPLTAQDVLFTFQLWVDGPEFQHFVQAFKAVDDHTVVLTFKIPAPHFKFDVLTTKFDTGMPILPAHVLISQADMASFTGGLNMVHSGPYNLVYWDASRKVFDLRPDWWAVTAGLIAPPAAKRVIFSDVSSTPLDRLASKLINNEFDITPDTQTPVITNEIKDNPKVTTYSGSAPPYGSLDWWPNSLWVNNQLAPYGDVRVRRALSLAIDRDRLDQDLYQGAPIATIYPFPLYPGLQKFADSPDVKALEAKYQPRKFDLAESAQLMTAAGFTKNADGLWARDGQTLDATIDALQGLHTDLAPALAEMLRRAGFDASNYLANDAFDRINYDHPGLYLFGDGASLIDPYATLERFHSRHNAWYSHYSNPAYDQIVDAMALLPADDPKFHTLATQAMEIYWRDVINIPIVQWLHRIPYNQTYWTNWPTQANPAMGTEGAFWHSTGMLVITSLKPAQ
jgi:ABC-type transport system substrate-binding protein